MLGSGAFEHGLINCFVWRLGLLFLEELVLHLKYHFVQTFICEVLGQAGLQGPLVARDRTDFEFVDIGVDLGIFGPETLPFVATAGPDLDSTWLHTKVLNFLR